MPASKPSQSPLWHTFAHPDLLRQLQVEPSAGLSAIEAEKRLLRHGRNSLPEEHSRGPLPMLVAQFSDFMILVLIAAAVVSGLIGEIGDTLAIVVIVILNALIGFLQDFRAERAMAALRQLSAPRARVRREGEWQDIDANALVPGDVVRIEAGGLVPADLRLVEVGGLSLGEAALTGESQAVEKLVAALDLDTPLAERRNMTYKGTLVLRGWGVGVVVATGPDSELGRIAALLASQGESLTPLQKRLADFGKRLAWGVLAICAFLFAAGVMRGEDIALMFLTVVSLAVAAIPEALPAVVTISLALGARRMISHRALIRRLPAVETLGSVTFICSDKTGTLTQNRMSVARVWQPPGIEPTPFFRAMALNNDCSLDPGGEAHGDPTEIALFQAALAAGQDKRVLEPAWPRVAELPFDAERRRMCTVHRIDEGRVAVFVKGAPETLLPLCPSASSGVAEAAEAMAAAGLRVMAYAWRPLPMLPADTSPASLETDLAFLGLAGLMDPPRPEARQAVAECRSAGIIPVMITGDHPLTARSVATELGILDDGRVLTGADLARLSAAEFDSVVADVRVYARVDPEQKIHIVEALQRRGEFVAMTGDGVNDAPALKRADIGVAMGRIGTDVAREASSLILLDDNFATIVAAVKEGRRIYDNLRKFVRYVMAGNTGEILTLALAPLLGLPIPLIPIQILWVNLVTDGLPGLALAAEPAEPGVMQRPPRHPHESILARGLWQHVLWVGLLIGGLCLATEALFHDPANDRWQTMVFTVLTLAQLFQVLATRSEQHSLLEIGLFSNRPLLAAVALGILLQLAVVYVPALNSVFRTSPLAADELALCLLLPAVVFVAVEVEKWLLRRGRLYRRATHRSGV